MNSWGYSMKLFKVLEDIGHTRAAARISGYIGDYFAGTWFLWLIVGVLVVLILLLIGEALQSNSDREQNQDGGDFETSGLTPIILALVTALIIIWHYAYYGTEAPKDPNKRISDFDPIRIEPRGLYSLGTKQTKDPNKRVSGSDLEYRPFNPRHTLQP